MAKNNNENVYVVQSLLGNALTAGAKMHKVTQAANQAAKDGDFDTMQENIDKFLPLIKELSGITAAINKYNTAE